METLNKGKPTKYLSFIVPVYNAGTTLEECLKAIRNLEDFAECELIVADDGSADSSLAIAKKYADKIVQTPTNKGAAFVRNLGVKTAEGEYILFIDSDVVLSLKEVIKYLKEDFSADNICGIGGIYAEKIRFNDFFSAYKHLNTCFGQLKLYKFSSIASSATMVIPRKAFFESGGFDENYPGIMAEDIEFSLRGAVQTKKNWLLDERLEGEHLKKYSFKSLLKTDYLRVKGIAKATQKKEYKISYLKSCSASVSTPLVSAFLGALFLFLSIFYLNFIWLAFVSVLVFILSQIEFFVYLKTKRGSVFAALALAFSFFEMLFAAACAVWWQTFYKFKKS